MYNAFLQTDGGRNKSSKIVIVGAGIAGLAAAEQLINAYNFNDVTILEALDRVGGRIQPIPFGDGVLHFGAEWVHGSNNEIYKLAKQLGALASQHESQRKITGSARNYYTENGCQLNKNQKTKLESMKDDLEETVDKEADQRKNRYTTTLGQLYEKNYRKYLDSKGVENDVPNSYYDAMFSFIKKSVEAEYGTSDWNKLAARSSWDYSDTVGDSDIELGPMGYKPILDWFVNRIPKEKIRLNTKVQNIMYRDNAQVKLTLSSGEIVYADHVIVTSSLGYLKRHYNEMFNPPLPETLRNTINSLGFDTVDKVFLIYDRPYPFWNAKTEAINFLNVKNDPRSCNGATLQQNGQQQLSKIFWGFETKPFYDNIIMAFISGEDVDVAESASVDDLLQAATVALRTYLNNPQIPKPRLFYKTTWKSNPMFLGSYSTYSASSNQAKCEYKSFQTPLFVTRNNIKVPAVSFAGEATSEHEFQTAHGALASGVREAKRINSFYTS